MTNTTKKPSISSVADLVIAEGRDITVGDVYIVGVEVSTTLQHNQINNHINLTSSVELIYDNDYEITTEMTIYTSDISGEPISIDKENLANSIANSSFFMREDHKVIYDLYDAVQIKLLDFDNEELKSELLSCDTTQSSSFYNSYMISNDRDLALDVLAKTFILLDDYYNVLSEDRQRIKDEVFSKIKTESIEYARRGGLAV